ncbi:MAG: hypothetical protein WAV13_10920 [Thermodesulfovibrionales bacterium]
MRIKKLFTRDVRGIAEYFKRLFLEGREFISEGAIEAALLFSLCLKCLRVRERFTLQEIREMRGHFKKVLNLVYAAAIFLLPGGLLILPFVTGALHKRD